MKTKSGQRILRRFTGIVFILTASAAMLPAGAQKLTVEEVVARHLDAIGSAEARKSVKSRNALGAVTVVLRLGGTGTVGGKSQLLSEGQKMRMAYAFDTLDYPGEEIAFNGEDVSVGWVRPGQRSPLSAFLLSYDTIVREGLLGGVLSTSWPLLEREARQPKLEYSGLKKIEGKQLHEVKYRARKGQSDLQISLYFDPETFRHVRTQYKLVRSAVMASDPTLSSAQQDTRYTLTEVFDKFKETDGLTLPTWTSLDLTIEGQSTTIMTHWTFTVTSIAHNLPVNPDSFTVR